MIEIAISLAVIGFALVAILGILPIGMGVQKQNREETIINQDASVFLDAIRNGARGLDDLPKYVMSITNTSTRYDGRGIPSRPQVFGYTPWGSTKDGAPSSPQFALTNGYRIVGLLSTPKYVPILSSSGNYMGYYSNRVVAYVRALSGPASEKYPQDNASVQDLAFSYRLSPEIVTYGTYSDPTYGNPQSLNLQSNLYELRLTFRWPLVDTRGRAGPVQQSFRTMIGGTIQRTTEFTNTNDRQFELYFFQPRTYVKAP